MQLILAIPTGVSLVLAGGFFGNEWTHGGLSETWGLGHHHMFDYGGYHCTSHNDTVHPQHHYEHMHANGSRPHRHCPGSLGMHDGGMPPHGG